MSSNRTAHGVDIDENFKPFEQKDHLSSEDGQGLCFGFTASVLQHLHAKQSLPEDMSEFYREAKRITSEATDAHRDGNNEYEAQFSQLGLQHERHSLSPAELKDALAKTKTAMLTYPLKSGAYHTLGFYKNGNLCVGFDAGRGFQVGTEKRVMTFLESVVNRSEPAKVTIDKGVSVKSPK
jgi:hypothetical protein